MMTHTEQELAIRNHIKGLNNDDLAIIAECATTYDVKLDDIFIKSRKQEIVMARHMASYYFYTVKMYSMEKIGAMLSIIAQDHTTVRNAIIKFKNHIQTEITTARNYSLLTIERQNFTSLKYKPKI
jgi:chromosomal replication initiation ATPase DnaA